MEEGSSEESQESKAKQIIYHELNMPNEQTALGDSENLIFKNYCITKFYSLGTS